MDYKEKQNKINRVLYVSVAVILCMMAIVVAITSSANRARKRDLESQPPLITTAPIKAPATRAPVTTAPPAPQTTPPAPDTEDDPTADSGYDSGADVPSGTQIPPEEDEKPVNAEPQETLPTFVLPADGTISNKHDLSVPVYSVTMNDYRIHNGIDISSTYGAPVWAAADGVISQVWEDPMMGHCMSIAHSGGAISVYKNLAGELPAGIEAGVQVRAGQLIAAVGESAMIEVSLEPHLHYELIINGDPADPFDYIDQIAAMTSADAAEYEE